MVDIAELGIRIDSSALGQGEARLRSFAGQAEQTERRVEQSTSGMANSARSAAQAFNTLTPALAAIEQHERRLAAASAGVTTAMQSQINAVLGIGRGFSSAADSAREFEAALAASDQLERLRMSTDSAYAASQRYAEAQLIVAEAVRRGAISQAEAATILERAERSYMRGAAGIDRAMDRSARSAGRMQRAFAGSGMRNVSLQLSQVAQQASATGDPIRALAIQLPDMAIGFGTVGIAAGVLAGVLLPVAASFFDTSDAANDLESSLDALADVTADVQSSLDLLSLDAVELAVRYGTAAERVREFAEVQAALRVSVAEAALRDQVLILQDTASAYFTVIDAGRNYRNALARIQAEIGITGDEARQFEAALTDLATAGNFSDQQRALGEIVRLLDEAGVSASDLPPELASAVDEAITLSNETDAAQALMERLANIASAATGEIAGGADEAFRLAGNIAAAVAAYNQIAGASVAAVGPDAARFGIQDELLPSGLRRSDIVLQRTFPARPSRQRGGSSGRGGGGGGGGGGGIDRAAQAFENWQGTSEEMVRELERQIQVIGMTAGEVAALEAEWRLLDQAQRAGIEVTPQMQAQIAATAAEVGNLTEEMERLGAQQQLFEDFASQIGDAIGSANSFGEAIDNIGDVFENTLRRMVARWAEMGMENILGALFGGVGGVGANQGMVGGGLLGAIFGGFRADGGPVSPGQAYVVGERGPELFVPPSAGNIVPNGGAAMGLHVTVSVEQNGNLRAFVRNESGQVVAQSAPQMVRQATANTIAQMRKTKAAFS